MWYFEAITAVILAYLIGSISSAILLCRLMHLPDPRKHGSGNPGATNVLRIGGKKIAILTLICDILKGVIPVVLGKWYGFSTFTLGLIAFAVFFGHLYPIFFRFQGGKGVATAFGCITALSWPLGVLLLAEWVIIAAIFRYSSLAAILTALLAPIYAYYLTNSNYTITISAISVFLIYRHRKNIYNLLKGKEPKIGQK